MSLHPVRETLPSLLLLQPVLCPLFNPAERPGNGGSKLISLGVCTDNAFVAEANVKLLLSMCIWVSAAGTTTNAVQAFVQMLFSLINHVLCFLILLTKYINQLPQIWCFLSLTCNLLIVEFFFVIFFKLNSEIPPLFTFD